MMNTDKTTVTDLGKAPSDFMEEIQVQTRMIGDRCDRLVRSIQNRGWKVANDAGIPRDGCCLHNASIDDDMRHWCAGSPERLRAAKRATAIIEGAWAISDLRERITSRIWNKTTPETWAKSPIRNDGRAVNVKLLFARV